jgi:predicted cytidylate kinase
MIITISGTAGSGKSTIAKLLAKKLGYEHYSVGDFRRKRAEDLGMDINEYNKLGEKDFSTDKEADEWQKNLSKKDNFVIDSRLGFHFLRSSFKIFLDADIMERAKRIYKDHRSSEKYSNIDQAVEIIKQRHNSDVLRYEKYYNLHPFKEENFDLIVDTTKINIQETINYILEKIKSHQESSA